MERQTYRWKDRQPDRWTAKQMFGWMDIWSFGRTDKWTDGGMNGRMYVPRQIVGDILYGSILTNAEKETSTPSSIIIIFLVINVVLNLS